MQVVTLASVDKIVKHLDGVQRRAVPQAMVRALNRSNARIRVLAARGIASKFKLSARKAKGTIAIPRWRKATRTNLAASGGVKVIIKEIDAGSSSGTRVIIRKGRKIHRWTGRFPTFQAKLKSGHKGVFVRTEASKISTGKDSKGRKRKNRLPINETYIDKTDEGFRFALDAVRVVSGEWEKRFSNELRFSLSKIR